MVMITYNLLKSANLPEKKKVVIEGNKVKVLRELLRLVKKCWEKNDYGDKIESEDCNIIFLNSKANISSEEIKNRIYDENLKANFKSVSIKEGKVRLKIFYDGKNGRIEIKGFQELLNGICEPEYGENCLFIDCKNCSSNICMPYYDADKIDEKGCVLPQYIGILNEGDKCKYDWECRKDLKCGKTIRFYDYDYACCPNGTGWNGVKCIRLKDKGEECISDEECKDDLKCNSVSPNFYEYSKACCTDGMHWNGTDCVFIEGEECSKGMCDINLKCSKNYPNSTVKGNFCCPEGKRWDGSKCKQIKLYDIYFVPFPDSYSQNPEYFQRAERYKKGVLERTPFKDCPEIVRFKILNSSSQIDNKQDLLVRISSSPVCNAFWTGPGNIVIDNGLPKNEVQDIVLPHEMGHEFRMCDEYLIKSRFISQGKIFWNGCGNPWPGDKGWRNIFQCTEMGGNPILGTCGMDMDGDPNTKQSSIMGGGAGFQLKGSCLGESLIEMPNLAPDSYKAFKEELKRRGFIC